MREQVEFACRQRIQEARRRAWRLGFDEAMRTVETNLAGLILVAEREAERALPGSIEEREARHRLQELKRILALATANAVERIDEGARLLRALSGTLEQMLAPLRDTTHASARHDPDLEGAADLVYSILLGLPLWPNHWGRDVAAAAWLLTDGGTRRFIHPTEREPPERTRRDATALARVATGVERAA